MNYEGSVWARNIVQVEDGVKCTQTPILGETGVWQKIEKLSQIKKKKKSLKKNVIQQLKHQGEGRNKHFKQPCANKTERCVMQKYWWQNQAPPV